MWSCNSGRHNDAIWRHRCRSVLVQVMACCLTAPSHYLKQSWLISSKVRLHSSTFWQVITHPSITKISLKITQLKFHINLPGANESNNGLLYRRYIVSTVFKSESCSDFTIHIKCFKCCWTHVPCLKYWSEKQMIAIMLHRFQTLQVIEQFF